LQKKLFSPAILPNLPGAVQILQKYIDTNLSVEEMLAIANFGRNVKREDVRMVLLPGRFNALSEYDGRSYWILNREQIGSIVRKNFINTATGEETSIAGLRIAVQNATNSSGLARRMRNYLVKQGYTGAYIDGDSPEKLSSTEIIVQKGDFQGANQLKSQLGIGRVESSSTGVLESDITLRAGEDAVRLLDTP
jgi:hypothetical protein